jgi:hypothetical protein
MAGTALADLPGAVLEVDLSGSSSGLGRLPRSAFEASETKQSRFCE